MNVLEKILEEIEEYEKRKCSGESLSAFESGIGRACLEAKEIIRSHMDDIPDTNVGGDNDTEQKIRVHIAECLHRIDNIRSFAGSKEHVNNDEKCIRNIEILKTSIAALEEYLRLKKKNGNDGWIPVEERLPEDGTYLCTLDGELCGLNEPFTGMCGIENGRWDEEGCVIAWMPLPDPYRPN